MKLKLLLFALLAFLVAGCMRESDDEESVYLRYKGNAPWTVTGVRPGMTLDELKKKRGEPSRTSGEPPNSFSWGGFSGWDQLTVETDSSGRITEVWGQRLMAGDQTLVSSGSTEADIKAVLGKGNIISMTQPGSFVLPTPGKKIGAKHYYRNGDVSFKLIVMKDQGITGIVAELKR
ncbi:MAG: hypothetical protein ABL931_21185 [Usitatibacteraceae bacterium]